MTARLARAGGRTEQGHGFALASAVGERSSAFTPGGVFTSFHVVGSTDVIVPKHVEVVLPGTSEPTVTLEMTDGTKPALFRVGESYLYLVMPLAG